LSDGESDSNEFDIEVSIEAVNDAPVVERLAKTMGTGDVLSLDLSTLVSGYRDEEGTALKAIKINSVPSVGTLKIFGAEVVEGREYLVTELPMEYEVPYEIEGEVVETVIEWQGQDGEFYSESGSINISIVEGNNIPTLSVATTVIVTEDEQVELNEFEALYHHERPLESPQDPMCWQCIHSKTLEWTLMMIKRFKLIQFNLLILRHYNRRCDR
jgi:hypothetical protein